MFTIKKLLSAVGFEPTSANTVELESTPLDRSGTLTIITETTPTTQTNQPHNATDTHTYPRLHSHNQTTTSTPIVLNQNVDPRTRPTTHHHINQTCSQRHRDTKQLHCTVTNSVLILSKTHPWTCLSMPLLGSGRRFHFDAKR